VPHVRHSKTELKAQREALSRFERFLPMLQLKKQQLQVEIRRMQARLTEKRRESEAALAALDGWVGLLAESADLERLVALERVETAQDNVAGVAIPVLTRVVVRADLPDLWLTPPWVDDAQAMLANLIRLRVEQEILAHQQRLVADELRITSQRVNLFEKVKIPECRENIRIIKIFLGDEQTAAVARAKIAKRRGLVTAEPDATALT